MVNLIFGDLGSCPIAGNGSFGADYVEAFSLLLGGLVNGVA